MGNYENRGPFWGTLLNSTLNTAPYGLGIQAEAYCPKDQGSGTVERIPMLNLEL